MGLGLEAKKIWWADVPRPNKFSTWCLHFLIGVIKTDRGLKLGSLSVIITILGVGVNMGQALLKPEPRPLGLGLSGPTILHPPVDTLGKAHMEILLCG